MSITETVPNKRVYCFRLEVKRPGSSRVEKPANIYIYIYERRSFGVYLTLCLVCLFDYFNYFNYFVAPRIEIIKIIKKIVWSSPRLFK